MRSYDKQRSVRTAGVIFAAVQLIFYNIFLFLYRTAIRIAALFHNKAKLWWEGRRDIIQKIKTTLPHDEQRIWIHCASLGEFEQGRPLIEALKKDYPGYKIVLTFFSPSGYELRKNYEHADYVFYLPMDGRRRSAKFIRAVNPRLAVFVKYEFWYYYICNLERYHIPFILISGAFRKEQPFFKWYGGLFRKMLGKFSLLFIQDEASAALLHELKITQNVMVAGDTRYDRVYEIAQAARSFPLIEQWKGTSCLVIAGSTWPGDEEVLKDCLDVLPPDWKLIIAPHETDQTHIRQLVALFGGNCLRYSELDKAPEMNERILIIDNIGMLSSLFRYGEIAYIGGGFQKGGIHNTLEPAVFGLPVIIGPVYEKFVEAVELVRCEFAFPVRDTAACKEILLQLIEDSDLRNVKQHEIKAFIRTNVGATSKIMGLISGKYLR